MKSVKGGGGAEQEAINNCVQNIGEKNILTDVLLGFCRFSFLLSFSYFSLSCTVSYSRSMALSDFTLATASTLPEQVQKQAAEMLFAEWPTGGDISTRLSHFQTSSSFERGQVSYILIRNSDQAVIGHVEIKPGVKTSANDAVGQDVCNGILLSVITHNTVRGTRLGKILLTHAEKAAISIGYAYLYLWTTDSVGFYEKSGYTRCESTSIDSAALKKVDVTSFENLLLKRLSLSSSSPLLPKPSQDLLLSRSASHSNSHSHSHSLPNVWLRKRLQYTMPTSIPVDDAFQASILSKLRSLNLSEEAVAEGSVTNQPADVASSPTLRYIRRMPICRQIGPSCGIAAITMLCTYYRDVIFNRYNDIPRIAVPAPHDSEWLLKRAIECGYSADGELFNIHHVCDLMNQWVNIQSGIKSSSITGAFEVDSITASVCRFESELKQMETMFDDPLTTSVDDPNEWKTMRHLLLPYDRTLRDNTPGLFRGHQAHYALLIGTVHSATQNTNDTSNITKTSLDDSTQDNIHLICVHGMSTQPVIAPASVWLTSNAQLHTVRSGSTAQHWVVDTSTGPQLAGKCVVVTTRYRKHIKIEKSSF